MTFMEGIEGQEVRGEGSDETGMWSVCIRWCEERYQDKNVSEDVKETVCRERERERERD